MCLLTYYPPGVQPDPELLANGASVNRNGYGYCIVIPKERLIIGKSMLATRMIDEFAALREKHPDGAALFHSRMATSGIRTAYNCHPFHVGNDRQTVIAHNGTLYRGQKGEDRSDTRIFAEQVMPVWFRRLNRPTMIPAIEKYVGPHNKMVILSANPKYVAQSWIVNRERGHWRSKAWYSNFDFMPATVWQDDEYAKAPPVGDMLDGKCIVCQREGTVDALTAVCSAETCGYCNDCFEPRGLCQCYSPGKNWDDKPKAITAV